MTTPLQSEIQRVAEKHCKGREPTQSITIKALTELATPLQQKIDLARDLLAIIHCDGGHHTAYVGYEQSIKDAIEIRSQLVQKIDRLETQNKALREALQGMSELCDNYFDESGLVCARDKEIWKQHLDALSLTTQPEQPNK